MKVFIHNYCKVIQLKFHLNKISNLKNDILLFALHGIQNCVANDVALLF